MQERIALFLHQHTLLLFVESLFGFPTNECSNNWLRIAGPLSIANNLFLYSNSESDFAIITSNSIDFIIVFDVLDFLQISSN
jgi:hypothetical protein